MKNQELQNYLQTQIVQSKQRLTGMSRDATDKPLFKRGVFSTLSQYAHAFLTTGGDPRMIVMPGLRGTGKTTLLAQLFLSLQQENVTKFYLSVDEVITRFGVHLWDVIENYEDLIDKHLEALSEPLILFFDEIHYDEKWALFLKTLYDKSKKIMVFCTGSAALLLREQINADVARRVFFVDIHPISFSEYMLFKHNKLPVKGLDQSLKEAILFSDNAKQVFDKLKKEKAAINQYWIDIDSFEMRQYIKFGTFPFTLRSQNEILALNFISQIISKVIYTDIPQFYKFELETLHRIEKLLYLISDALGVSVTKLSETLEMKPDTLRLILKSLESSGLLFRISPYGSHFKQVKKQSKYLFATPSLRFSYLSSKDSVGVFDHYQGSLLEDVVAMCLFKIQPQQAGFSITYDISEGGADFIVAFGNDKIVIEVGTGHKGYKQTLQTSEKVKPKYSLVVSNSDLEYSQEFNAVKIPLKYFLLV